MPPHSAPTEPPSPLPYGIAERHIDRSRVSRLHPWLVAVVLGVPLLAAMLGLLGGGVPQTTRAVSPQASVTIETPRVLRSGNWFETRVVVEPAVDVSDLTIAVDQSLWRRMSIDTMMPDAEKAAATGGSFVYSFGPVRRGDRFVLKLDGQIQPYGLRRLRGQVAVRDGTRALVSLPVSVLVLP